MTLASCYFSLCSFSKNAQLVPERSSSWDKRLSDDLLLLLLLSNEISFLLKWENGNTRKGV